MSPGRCEILPEMARAGSHPVRCPFCESWFELFDARWCRHSGTPSKECSECGRCLCQHPSYAEPRYWKPAPNGFQRAGFRRLHLLYL